MKTTVSIYDFRDAFLQSDTRKDTFSYQGLTALYEYFEQYEEDCDTEIDFDMVAICCEYTEYERAVEAADNYTEFTDVVIEDETSEENEERALEFLQENTQVIEFDGGIIIQDF